MIKSTRLLLNGLSNGRDNNRQSCRNFFCFEIHASAYLAIFIACTIALHSESIIT